MPVNVKYPVAQKYIRDDNALPCNEVIADYASFNTRSDFDAASVADLAQSILSTGQLQHVVVDQISDPALLQLGFKYQLRAGFRRFKAVNEVLKAPTIKATIYSTFTSDEALAVNYVENDQRRPLSFHEEAGVVQRFMDNGTDSMVKIGQLMNKTHEWVRLRQLYLSLPAEVQDAVQKNELSQVDLRKVGAEYKKNPEYAMDYFRSVRRTNRASMTRGIKDDTAVPVKRVPRSGKMKSNIAIRSLLAMFGRLYEENDHAVVALKWVLGEATDDELSAAAYAAFVGSDAEFKSIFLIGECTPAPTQYTAVSQNDCPHPTLTTIDEGGQFRAVCTVCNKRSGHTAPDPESAKALIDL